MIHGRMRTHDSFWTSTRWRGRSVTVSEPTTSRKLAVVGGRTRGDGALRGGRCMDRGGPVRACSRRESLYRPSRGRSPRPDRRAGPGDSRIRQSSALPMWAMSIHAGSVSARRCGLSNQPPDSRGASAELSGSKCGPRNAEMNGEGLRSLSMGTRICLQQNGGK